MIDEHHGPRHGRGPSERVEQTAADTARARDAAIAHERRELQRAHLRARYRAPADRRDHIDAAYTLAAAELDKQRHDPPRPAGDRL